jgi:hypothetical protein
MRALQIEGADLRELAAYTERGQLEVNLALDAKLGRTPEEAAAFYGAGYLAALQERAEREFPDVDFTLVVDCGDAPGWALSCLRAGVKVISMDPLNEKIADIARQMGAQLVRRPT